MKKQLRLCIVSPLFHPNLGGPGRQSYTMADRLRQSGAEVFVICRHLNSELPDWDIERIHAVRSFMPERHTLSDFTFMNFVASLSFALGAMAMLLHWRSRYDIVQFYGGSLPLLVCLPLLKILQKKVVVKISGAKKGMEAGSLEGSFWKSLVSPFFSLVDRFIAMSNELRLRLLKEGMRESDVVRIPNGVDTELFHPLNSQEKESLRETLGFSGKTIIIYSGRLAQGKGLEILLGAAAVILPARKDVWLVLLGDGPLKTELEQRVHDLGIAGSVLFKGSVADVQKFLGASDIYAFPSFSEGMPNALLEAMACGLPSVSSEIGGVVDIVENGLSGILFPPGDISAMTSALLSLLGDVPLRQRMGAAARQRAVKDFSIDGVRDKYIGLYESLPII